MYIFLYAPYLAGSFLCAALRYKKSAYRSIRRRRSVAHTNPDIVAVTHGHYDHLGETVSLAKKTVAITEIARYLRTKGLDVEGMNLGDDHHR